MIKHIISFFILFFICISQPYASYSDDYIKIDIIPEYTTISSATKNISFISEIKIAKGWHLYWDNPGDTGEPVALIPNSSLLKETKTQKSKPSRVVFDDIITSFIYKDKLYIKSDFIIEEFFNTDVINFDFILRYTACKDECITKELPIDIIVNIDKQEVINSDYKNKLLIVSDKFPIKLKPTASFNNDTIKLEFENSLINCSTPEYASLYPKKNILSDQPKTQKVNNKILEIYFDKENPKDFKGILFCDNDAYKIDPILSINFDYSLIYYILTAFIAGIILNLMPCVLPILGLKALYLVQNNKKTSIYSALLYLLGVLSSFGLLAGILFYLRIKGEQFGWGFQLQSPVFNTILLLLFFAIFLNLIDKLPIPDKCANKLNKLTRNKSFLMGFFAVMIACPCTGPFMGAALGYAITKPTLIYFSIFLALGLGYALPYTLIELFPKFFLKFIPKPGHWMITLKRILALPIALTCLWLGWLIYNQLTPVITNKKELYWENYDRNLIDKALENKQSVFINFTAKWCLVCLLNDKTTLSTDRFKNFVKQNNIRLFKADWTTKDDNITNALKLYNRSSIPLYVYYNKGSISPIILPQILTGDIIENKVKDTLITQ